MAQVADADDERFPDMAIDRPKRSLEGQRGLVIFETLTDDPRRSRPALDSPAGGRAASVVGVTVGVGFGDVVGELVGLGGGV